MKHIMIIIISATSLLSCSSAKHWNQVSKEKNGLYRERFVSMDSAAEGKNYLFAEGKFSRIVPAGDYFAIQSIRTDENQLAKYSVYSSINKELKKLDIITPQSLIVDLTDDDNKEIFELTGVDLCKQHGIRSLELNLVAVDETNVMYSVTTVFMESVGKARSISFFAITKISENNAPNKEIIYKYYIITGDRNE